MSSQVLPRKRLEHLIVKTLIEILTRIKMVKIKNLGLTKTVNLSDKNIENKCMYNMLRVRDRNFMWFKYVKHILCNCGFNYIWESQTFIN